MFPDKRSLKLLKSQSINVNWYLYNPETAVILLSTTVQGNVLQPLAFKVEALGSAPSQLGRTGGSPHASSRPLPERDHVQDVQV